MASKPCCFITLNKDQSNICQFPHQHRTSSSFLPDSVSIVSGNMGSSIGQGLVSLSIRPLLQTCSMWLKKKLHVVISLAIFTLLDFLDCILCIGYAFLDKLIDGTSSPCYCHKSDNDAREGEVSDTLYGRRNICREIGLFKLKSSVQGAKRKAGRVKSNIWSDCGCESCISWMKNGDDLKLHVLVQEPQTSPASTKGFEGKVAENVVFLHGMLSSSSFWKETVFKCLSEDAKSNYRLFAADLLGFGRSPKPSDCLYTLDDHVEMIEKSIIKPFGLNSFHLVGHSMGSIIALALAAKHPQSVKSVTLIAPPYMPSSKEALTNLAGKRLWPPLAFGASLMSWYEHLGRTVCFVICKHHRIWEFFLRVITGPRDLHFSITDMTKHTHHSAWHSMHNVIFGGAEHSDDHLQILKHNKVKMTVIQGDKDQIVPLECSFNIKIIVDYTNVLILPNRDHSTIVRHQTKEFTQTLVNIWMSCN